jgi:hypothetical protein
MESVLDDLILLHRPFFMFLLDLDQMQMPSLLMKLCACLYSTSFLPLIPTES